MSKSKRYDAKCRQCDRSVSCKKWARAINVPSENPWETCGEFKKTDRYVSDGEAQAYYRGGVF